MSTQHTPGPWEACILDRPLDTIPEYVRGCIEASPADEFFFIAASREDGLSVDVCHVGNGPRRAANARLIAAAPELLACLKHAVRFHDQLNAEDIARYRAAIFKAEQATP